jgi:hypothetical protein
VGGNIRLSLMTGSTKMCCHNSCTRCPASPTPSSKSTSLIASADSLEGTCHLHAEGSVKSVSRMEVKVREYRSAGETNFSTSLVSDPLRATVVCTNSHAMVKALEAVTTGIPSLTIVLRMKNKLAELKKPLNIHVNPVFQPPNTTPVTVEIQFMHEVWSVRFGSKYPSTRLPTLLS